MSKFILESLQEINDKKPLMRDEFYKTNDYSRVFHADLQKVLKLFEFNPLGGANINHGFLPTFLYEPSQVYRDIINGKNYKFGKKYQYETDHYQLSYRNLYSEGIEMPQVNISLFFNEKEGVYVSFKNGRHRTRFLEFIGSRDIYLLVSDSEYDLFEKHCAYLGKE